MLRVRFTIVFLTVFTLAPFAASVVFAEDSLALVKKGRAIAQGCTRCHGRHGIGEAAGRAGAESVGLFAKQELMAFKSGLRSHPIMTAVAQTLSEDDIDLIALWLESVR